MLRLALLGYDLPAHDLARAALDSEDMQLVALCQADEQTPLDSLPATIRREAHWEWLLHDDSVDAVIVASRGIPEREDALRKLVQAGKPLLITFPPCEALFAFELEMIRRDGGGPILTYIPQAVHPLTTQLLSLDEQVGDIELATFLRRLPDCTRQAVREAFAADCGIFRSLLGRISQISATGVTPNSPNEANLAITLQNEAQGVGRWSVEPASEASATLLVRGSRGKAQLNLDSAANAWTLELPSGEQIAGHELPPEQQPATMALEQLREAIATPANAESWDQVCRDLEVADMIDHSLRRSRTIELYDDEVSERGTFKGMMAAGGCFLLLFAMFVLFMVSVVEGLQAPFRNHFLWRLWPVYLLAPILIFLLLQLLQLAISKPKSS
jgi:predicted dehydrogenase